MGARLIERTHIQNWAQSFESKGDFPILISKLVRASTIPSVWVDFPSGSAAFVGGWDGVVISEDERGYVPANDETKELSPAFIESANQIKIENFYPTISYQSKKEYINDKYNSINELTSGESDDHAALFIPLLDLQKIDTGHLLNYLQSKNLKIEDLKTPVRKLICLYDFIKYKLQL